MKPAIIPILMVLLGCSAGAQIEQEFDGAKALQYVETQLGFGPRIPNTEGHIRTGDWLLERLRATADSVEVQAWNHVSDDGDTLSLRNFIGRFRPEATERILYVAHWDTRPKADRSSNMGRRQMPVPGANDGASGVALLLGVADALALNPPSFGVDLLFVDGEDYGDFGRDLDVLMGSRYYAEQLDPEAPKPLFAVVWDMVGDSDLQIKKERYSEMVAPEVVNRVWRKAVALGYGRIFQDGPGYAIIDDHIPLLRNGIRCINIIDFDYPHWHTPEDTPDKCSPESLRIVAEVLISLIFDLK